MCEWREQQKPSRWQHARAPDKIPRSSNIQNILFWNLSCILSLGLLVCKVEEKSIWVGERKKIYLGRGEKENL
jgi:hypothetical protein